jgi:hypothetical protein
MKLKSVFVSLVLFLNVAAAQDYFTARYTPFDSTIQSPEAFLERPVGAQHTRHDQIVAYLEYLAKVSPRAKITYYGKTHEGRKLPILIVGDPSHLEQLDALQAKHLAHIQQPSSANEERPLFINLGYNVHGNEPSSSEAALLAAYTFSASQSQEVLDYLAEAIIFIDPTINPDGRDRHTQWANTYQGSPLVADPNDAEHNEYWPGGRTNHYWFDLNRDWLLAINPESQGKLAWYHQWYPNVVTDFHEMGSQSTYFFEPMKDNGSADPIMPKENYGYLNERFGNYFAQALDSIGSLYFTKEVFDGTYPGYGSSYPDLQGGLGILFEQASSRGHVQKTPNGQIKFPFTIRNQFISSITTVKAAVATKEYLQDYQKKFFASAMSNAAKQKIKAYVFEEKDQNLANGFIDKLLRHQIEVYQTSEDHYSVPTQQPQYRMVQSFFETYSTYRDSVFYDASAWSVANFYNIKYAASRTAQKGQRITSLDQLPQPNALAKSDYAYVVSGQDYNVPALIHALQQEEVVVSVAFKPFRTQTHLGNYAFPYGSLMIPVSTQKVSSERIYQLLTTLQKQWSIQVHSVATGYNLGGVDLGSRYVQPLKPAKAVMLIGDGVRSYEAGEVWHLLDARVNMPITKVPKRTFGRLNLDEYNTLVMVSGRYDWDEKTQQKIKNWVAKGNTLIAIGTANEALIKAKILSEKQITIPTDSTQAVERKPYVDAPENRGREQLGGVFVKGILDLTHPLGFGYRYPEISLYKNNLVWLSPSKSPYNTVIKYAEKAHIDGYISPKISREYLPKAASLLVSPVGQGRIISFADNPNFRGSAYGTNRLFLNALMLGDKIQTPKE